MAKTEDLELALLWCEQYEGDDRQSEVRMERAVGWLKAQIARRRVDAAARQVSRRAGVPLSKARAAVEDEYLKGIMEKG